VRDSAAVGVATTVDTAGERVHIVLALDRGVDPDAVVRDANARLESHQKIRRALVWPQAELPRTEGTGKLKRAAIREWVRTGAAPAAAAPAADKLSALVAKYAGVVTSPQRRRSTSWAQFTGARRADGRDRGRVSDAPR
jgi:hypothetical protein